MMRKLIRWILLPGILLGMLLGYLLFGPATAFSGDKVTLLIRSADTFEAVQEQAETVKLIRFPFAFKWVSAWLGYQKQVKPGRYVFTKNASLFQIIRVLRNGSQTPVKLVINKLRLPEDLDQKIGEQFECGKGSVMALVRQADSLKTLGVDSNTLMTLVIPNTYEFYWNTPADRILKKLAQESHKFWNEERKAKASALGLSPIQIYILASIVEEETNMPEDKGKIASVYLNRMETGMKLGADPTVKFAMRDFSLTRIYHKHLDYPSPYNTYQVSGLPPGPICTPSVNTLDAVLNAPATTYLYFVAKPDFKGYSNFASSYAEHLQYAKAYQTALNEWMKQHPGQ